MKKFYFYFTLALVVVFGTISCDLANDDMDAITSVGKFDEMSKSATAPGDQSITWAVVNTPRFSVLKAALIQVKEDLNVDLVALFDDESVQYTVFAPNNDAFIEVLNNTPYTALSDIPSDALLDILLYHVTDGRRSATSVVPKFKSKKITTLLFDDASGSYRSFMVDNSGAIEATTVTGEMATIIGANLFSASNGIIHEIDRVIFP